MSLVASILAKATAEAEERLAEQAAQQDVTPEVTTQATPPQDVTPQDVTPAVPSRVKSILDSVLNATQDEQADVTQDVVETPQDDVEDVQADEPQDATDALEDTQDAGTDEPTEVNRLLAALEEERAAIATEREALVKERDDALKLARDADKKLKQTLLSHALVTRTDVKDARIVAQLVKLDAVDATPEAISAQVGKVLKAYPSLTTSGIAPDEVVTTTTQEGLVLRSKARPIGKAMGQTQEVPRMTKTMMLEKARRKAARSGRPEDRVAYAQLKRKYGQ